MPAVFRRQPVTGRVPLAPIAALAAAGLVTVATPAHAAEAHNETTTDSTVTTGARQAGTLAKQAAATSTPVMAVLGAPARSGKYTVRSGDTLSGIAGSKGVSVAALKQANGISGTLIHPGQKLTIPGAAASSSSAAKPASTGTSTPKAGAAYTVRSGDTFSSIAARAGVSTAAVQAINPGVAANALQVGQKISLPSGSNRAVGSTFAGRTYPEATVNAANSNHSTLASRPKASRESLQRTVSGTASRYGVDPALAQAIAKQESGFQQHVVSPANAVGVMQVTPSAGRWASEIVGRDLDLLDPNDNATAGVVVLRANLRGAASEDEAIAAYYQGLSSVRKNGMYTDTKTYVSSVQRIRAQYR